MHWVYLMIAIFFEVAATTCTRLSKGFTVLLPSILLFVFYGVSFAGIVMAQKRIHLGVAYAVWCGIGMFLISLIGIFHFKEPVTAVKIISFVLITAGITGLCFAPATSAP